MFTVILFIKIVWLYITKQSVCISHNKDDTTVLMVTQGRKRQKRQLQHYTVAT